MHMQIQVKITLFPRNPSFSFKQKKKEKKSNWANPSQTKIAISCTAPGILVSSL
ncbi:hypothetical protein QJS04_geneDACA025026 [Acorus gramineus]|uniref:Uncharacterized protein n=1 Tax=Acorus gramineus TaxID=55184 RepID=A0AAV8ZZH7_ACOGR|nr:hypothetical protein QJS04_geneDACA025026 [Acorus gramineus]